MDEIKAIRRLKRGDLNGLETLVLHYQSRAVRTAYLVTLDSQLAEDAVQNAFLRAYDYIARYDASRPFGPWFFRIVTHEAVKASLQSRRQNSLEDELNGEGTTFTEWLAGSEVSVEEQVILDEQCEAVEEALKQVSIQDREAIVLRYYLGYTEGEMAEELDVASGTVKWRLHMARRRLANFLHAYGFHTQS